MEAEISSLKEALISAFGEKEEALARNEFFNSEVEALSDKLLTADSEIKSLKEEVAAMVCPSLKDFCGKICLLDLFFICYSLQIFDIIYCCRQRDWLSLNHFLKNWNPPSILFQEKKKRWDW